jgi:predicted transcriptional regulator
MSATNLTNFTVKITREDLDLKSNELSERAKVLSSLGAEISSFERNDNLEMLNMIFHDIEMMEKIHIKFKAPTLTNFVQSFLIDMDRLGDVVLHACILGRWKLFALKTEISEVLL